MRSTSLWLRRCWRSQDHQGHGVYLMRLSGVLLGLALAVASYAKVLGERTQAAAAQAHRRAPEAPDRNVVLAGLVGVRWGLVADPEAVAWVPAHQGAKITAWLDPAEHLRAVFAASVAPGAARDLFVADVALAGGRPARVSMLRNLTESPAADEADVVGSGDLVAAVRWVEGDAPTVLLFDTRGQDPALTAGWPLAERLKDGVTNFQETGRWSGFHRTEVRLASTPRALRLAWEGDLLAIETDEGTVRVDARGEVRSGTGLVAGVAVHTKAIRAHLAWAVDTVRSWVGPGPIEALEHIAFKLVDRYKRVTVSREEAARAIAASLPPAPAPELAATYRFELRDGLEDLDLGWPPPNIAPAGVHGPMAGEGEWVPVVDEDFVTNEPGAPATFYSTFLRTDAQRPFSVVYLVAWDPRRVTLHPSGGSIEPKAATGETSSGMVPRDDATIRRLVAAFNGGFQALHGEFGLGQDGKLYLPPKPWGGMVFLLRGGRTAVGTWPGPDEDVALYDGGAVYDQDPNGVNEAALERFLGEQGVISFRQNLTPLFGHGQVNPYRRTWWGSSPKDLEDPNPVTVRSSLCWTRYGHMTYFYGLSTNLDALVAAIQAAGCRYGLHLDMNTGNVGWEFYRIVDAGTPAPSRMRAGFQAEGSVPGREDLRFRARTLFQGMDIFRFPRYIRREPRDFFYLVLQRNLPLPDVDFEDGKEGDGVWSQRGLPVQSFPPPMMFTSGLADATGTPRVYLLAIDPRWTSVTAAGGDLPEKALGAFVPAPDATAVWRGEGEAPFSPDDAVVVFAQDPLGLENRLLVDRWSAARAAVGNWPVVLALRGVPLSEASRGVFAAAFGVRQGERFLLYAESGSGDGALLYRTLRAAGADRIVGISRADGAGWVFLYGQEERRPLTNPRLAEGSLAGAAVFSVSGTPPVVEVLSQTQVVPPGVWNPPHTRRIRYFRTDDHRLRALRSY